MNIIPEPTSDMKDFFEKRTSEHVNRVIRNMQKVAINSPLQTEILERSKLHDQSKWSKDEKNAYIWLTERYRCKNENIPFAYPSKEAEDAIDKVVEIHYKNNRHHPECHNHINDMTDIDIIEMVCDWTAMSQEYGEKSARDWANKNVGNKWKFSSDQEKLIYDTIETLESWSDLLEGQSNEGATI
jgi:hypothetical protein